PRPIPRLRSGREMGFGRHGGRALRRRVPHRRAAGARLELHRLRRRDDHFQSTAIRVTGQGLFVQDHTKTRAGMRTIRPPGWVMDVLKRRHVESVSQWVFPTSTGSLRDPSNTAAQFRKVVAGTPFEGLSPHDFRHYVADALDRAGLSAREIADYLGHERISTTQETYMERGAVGERAGAALGERPPLETKDRG